MVTKKTKKAEFVDGLDIPIATDAKAFRKAKEKKSSAYPIVVRGSHLTVTTYEDGSTKLEWDDEALLRDVQNAIIKHGTPESVAKVKSAVKAKSSRKTKVQSQ